VKEWDNDNKSLFSSWSFGKINYQLFGIGLLTIILIIGYCILIPAAILVKPKEKN